MRKENGITLIALVITILVLLILAGVTIVTLTGDNGLLQKAGEAKDTATETEGLERIQLAVMASRDENGIDTTLLAKNLSQINGLTDMNNNAIEEDTVIALPQNINLNNFKYRIKEDGTVEEGLLPKEYQQVEYIESTGTQYIDTEKYITKDMKIEFRYNSNQNSTGTLIGAMNTPNGYPAICFWAEPSAFGWRFGNSNWNDTTVENWVGTHNVKILYRKIIFDGVTYDATSSVSWNNMIYTFSIFAIHRWDGFVSRTNEYKLYYLKIYDEENKIINNFIPCYRKIDNEIGLYDTVEGKFYTNQGTGTFGYGMEDGIYVAPQNN